MYAETFGLTPPDHPEFLDEESESQQARGREESSGEII
jgi:hypothetical protein